MVTYDYHMTMKKARVAELKARLSEYLRAVRNGHEVTIYDRDTPIARLVPLEQARAAQLVIRKPIRKYKNLGEIPMPPPVNIGIDVVDVLVEDRNAELERDTLLTDRQPTTRARRRRR
jgi:prevent-host-death family protein